MVGCLQGNPDWSSEDPSGGSSSSSTTAAASTSAGGGSTSGEASTTTGSTTPPASTGSVTAATAATTGMTAGSASDGDDDDDEVRADAAIAECYGPALAVSDCESSVQLGIMTVDGGPDAQERRSFMRFDYELPAGAQVTSVELRVTASGPADCAGDSTGELWELEEFDLSDLTGVGPQRVQLRSGGIGPVSPGAELEFELPSDAVGPTGAYFELSSDTEDEVCFSNSRGREPPEIRIEFTVPG